jgi:hypothetical protein
VGRIEDDTAAKKPRRNLPATFSGFDGDDTFHRIQPAAKGLQDQQ